MDDGVQGPISSNFTKGFTNGKILQGSKMTGLDPS